MGQLESRVKGRLKAGSEMNLLALGKSLKGHIAATASSAGSEVGGHGRRGGIQGGRGLEGGPEVFSAGFPAGIVPQASAEAHHVSQERPEAAPVPAHRGEGKCDEEDKGDCRIPGNGEGLEDPTAQGNEGLRPPSIYPGVGDEICDVTTEQESPEEHPREHPKFSQRSSGCTWIVQDRPGFSLEFDFYPSVSTLHLRTSIFYIQIYRHTYQLSTCGLLPAASPPIPAPPFWGTEFLGTASRAAGSVPSPPAVPQSLSQDPKFTGMGVDNPDRKSVV